MAYIQSEHMWPSNRDSTLCSSEQNWMKSDWRTDQPGAYTGMLWEYGPTGECFINTTINAPCNQGYVPHYSVNASSVEEIQAAAKFADKHDLLLAINNIGHDHLGQSSAGEGFSTWTHNLKGMKWHHKFEPDSATMDQIGVPAATTQAGEQWVDVYDDAGKQRRIVIGGHARAVGAAGGWLTGGGHSAFSKYGLGIDHVLQLNVVTAQGEHVVINEHTNPAYFWAIRDGCGCVWGVLVSVTYATHPQPNHIQVVFVQVNATDEAAFRRAMAGSFKGIDTMTATGYTSDGVIVRPADNSSTFPVEFSGLFNLAGDSQGIETAGTDIIFEP